MKEKLVYVLLAAGLLLFVCGCANEKQESNVSAEPNGSVQSCTILMSSSSLEVTTTTRAPPVSINPIALCFMNKDCGVAYLGSCSCDGDSLKATQYIPLCLNGSCVWKSKTDVLSCQGRDYESGDNSSGQRCVNGFGRCIKNSEYEKYMVLRPNVTVINGTNASGYSEAYRGYSFKNNMTGFYPGDSFCYENEYFILDVKKPYGEFARIETSWNKSVVLGSIVVKVGGVWKDVNGSDNPILWARKARVNDSGYF